MFTALLLTVQVLKTGKISFFQLPIGLLLRCCFTDCLFALYIQRAGKERAYEELDLRTIEYANSMLERKEVYRDQVKSTGKILDDVFIDHLWELTMEYNFLGLLTLDDNLEELTVIKHRPFCKGEEICMKHVLCFGDSNTWGFIPGTCKRYDEHTRWTGILQDELGWAICLLS